MKLNIISKLLIFTLDATVAFFIFQIIAGILAYVYYVPPVNGSLVTWVGYYVICYITWHRTLGQYFFNAGIIDNGNKLFVLRVILRELTTSLPAVVLLLFGWNYLSPIRFLITLLICGSLAISRKKIFKITIAKWEQSRANEDKYIFKKVAYIFIVLIISATGVRVANTLLTNDVLLINERPMYAVPRPSGHSVKKYTDFLQQNKSDIKDYIFGLFEKYDHVILCERAHREMTQYDLIYDVVSDTRFVDSVSNLFTEIGCVDSREAYKRFVDMDYKNEEEVDSCLASFMTVNQSVHLLWPNTNWFNFLKRLYYLNHGKASQVNLLFSDRNWIDRAELDSRDSIMADNIISTLKSDSLKKSLIIMNYRHSYLTPGNCGYYISQAFPGKVANVMVNTGSVNLIDMLLGKETMMPTMHGKWDVAFRQVKDSDYAFNFDGSPFGDDDFDHFVMPWNHVRALKYKDMFTGFIHYKAPEEQFESIGYNHIFDPDNEKKLRARESAMKGYSLDYWKEQFKNGIIRQNGIELYYSSGIIQNQIYIVMCIAATILIGIMGLMSYYRIYKIKKHNK